MIILLGANFFPSSRVKTTKRGFYLTCCRSYFHFYFSCFSLYYYCIIYHHEYNQINHNKTWCKRASLYSSYMRGPNIGNRQRMKNKVHVSLSSHLACCLMFRACLLSEVLIGKFSTSQEHVPRRPHPARLGH